ncbi:MAG: hypothetical protein FJ218_02125 [Ignavibacteria bacterium]|nr:hypothetical protein [Ignavibacteria bacterium]
MNILTEKCFCSNPKIFILCFLFISFLFIGFSSQQKTRTARGTVPETKDTLHIQSLNVWQYSLKFGVQEEYGRKIETSRFDSLGNVLERITYLDNDVISSIEMFMFDSATILLEKVHYTAYYDSTDSAQLFHHDSLNFVEEEIQKEQPFFPRIITSLDTIVREERVRDLPYGGVYARTRFFYNEKRLKVEEKTERIDYDSISVSTLNIGDSIVIDDEEGIKQRIDFVKTFRYNSSNNRIAINVLIAGNEVYNLVFQYNKYGKQREKVQYDFTGALRKKISYRYSERGVLTDDVWYDADGKVLAKSLYKYDGRGNEIEFGKYTTERMFSEGIRRVYDKKGRKTEEIFLEKNGRVAWKNSYSYNKEGFVAEQLYYKKNSAMPFLVRKFEYEYFPVKKEIPQNKN